MATRKRYSRVRSRTTRRRTPWRRSGRRIRQFDSVTPTITANLASRFQSAAAGYSGLGPKRARTGGSGRTRSRTVTRRRLDRPSGGGVQWTRSRLSTGRLKRGYPLVSRLASVNGEKLVYRLRTVKNFDNDGYQKAHKTGGAGIRYYPFYAILLNGKNCGESDIYPFRRLFSIGDDLSANDGRLGWHGLQTQDYNGNATLRRYGVEFGADSGQQDKMLWRSTSIKMNLWGAKQKPVRWTVEVVRVTDHRVSPFARKFVSAVPNSGELVNAEAQQNLEAMMKQYYFNPIATINWHQNRHFKVLKRFDMVIQPVESTDGDQDPKCHQLNWVTKWDRVLDFSDQNVAGDSAVFNDDEKNFEQVQEVNNVLSGDSHAPKGTGAVFLMIRASDFSAWADAGPLFSSNVHGSFDFDIRTSYVKNS